MFNRSVNKVVLVGNLGKDPEMRYMPNGSAVASLTLATTESWKDKQTGERKDKTEWHRLTVFNRLGEMCGEYLQKGAKVYIEGKLQTRKWQDQSGQDRHTTEVVVSEIQMMDASNKQQGAPQQNAPQQQQQSWGQAPANHAPQQAPQQQPPAYQQPQQHQPMQQPMSKQATYQGSQPPADNIEKPPY